MSENLKTYTTATIEYAIITNFAGGKSIDISNLITSYYIQESIYQNGYNGYLKVVDSVGLLENFPLIGEEYLKIKIKTNDFNKEIVLDLFIYKISNVMATPATNGLFYEIHFLSKINFNGVVRKVVTAFQKPISDSFIDVFANTFEPIEKDQFEEVENGKKYSLSDGRFLIVENTIDIVRVLIPNYFANEAVNLLASKASNENNKSCSFKFFETIEGFYFVSDEFLIKKAKMQSEIKKLYYNDNYNLKPDGDNYDKLVSRIEILNNMGRIDTLQDLYSGSYNSNIIVIDPFESKITDNKFKLMEKKDLFHSTSKSGQMVSKHSEEFSNVFFNDENERKYVFLKDYDTYSNLQLKGDTNTIQIFSNRNSYEHIMSSTKLEIELKGRMDIRAGMLIDLEIYEMNSVVQNRELNKQLSGNYIVSRVNNAVVGAAVSTNLEILKYGWG